MIGENDIQNDIQNDRKYSLNQLNRIKRQTNQTPLSDSIFRPN